MHMNRHATRAAHPIFRNLLVTLLFAACGGPSSDPAPPPTLTTGHGSLGPGLGGASTFAILGASTVTCTNTSTVAGDVGVSPGTAITGFNPDCTLTGQIHSGDVVAAQAHSDAQTAYGVLASAACQHNMTGSDLGSTTLVPGVYCFDSSAGLTGQLTLDGGGDANATWTFQIGTTLTTASGSSVLLINGAAPCNVFWQVGSSATIGSGTAFQGNIIALASISLVSGSSLSGRALALTGAVTMDHNTVAVGDCSVADGGTRADAGSTRDGGSRVDAGTLADAGTTPDAGALPDAGAVADAGSIPDAGSIVDAGATCDSGSVFDAGPPDAGSTCDAGPALDAGVPDAGPPDAGCGEWSLSG
jgi:hypothetical protein